MIVKKKILTDQNYPAYQMKETLKVVYGDALPPIRTNKEAMAFVRPMSDELKQRWNDSNQTDFTIYSDPTYVAEGFISFYEVSVECHRVIGRWAQNGMKGLGDFEPFDPKTKTFFDLYNGIGLGTLHLVALGFDVTIHNDNPDQVAAMQKLFDYYDLEMPKVIGEEWRDQKFDIVSAFEVIEHFKDPIQITRDLAGCVKVGGMLFESTGFAVGTYPGHFTQYNIGERVVTGLQASKAVSKTFKEEGLTKLFSGFSGKPRVWKKG